MFILPQELPKTGFEYFDDLHQAEIENLNELFEKILLCEKGLVELEDVIEIFSQFLTDVVEHFAFENTLMKDYAFFPYPFHREEHDRLIYELKSVESNLKENRNVSFLKDYLAETFKPWLINHVKTMDSVTAEYLKKHMA